MEKEKYEWKATYEVYHKDLEDVLDAIDALEDPPHSRLKSVKLEALKEGESENGSGP